MLEYIEFDVIGKYRLYNIVSRNIKFVNMLEQVVRSELQYILTITITTMKVIIIPIVILRALITTYSLYYKSIYIERERQVGAALYSPMSQKLAIKYNHYMCMHMCIYIYTHIHTCICMCIYIYIIVLLLLVVVVVYVYVYVYVCICICMYTCLYIYTCIYTYTCILILYRMQHTIVQYSIVQYSTVQYSAF